MGSQDLGLARAAFAPSRVLMLCMCMVMLAPMVVAHREGDGSIMFFTSRSVCRAVYLVTGGERGASTP